MTMLEVFNPANGERIAQLRADDAASVAAKAAAARAEAMRTGKSVLLG